MSSNSKRKATRSVSPPPVKRKVASTISKTAVTSFFTPASQKSKSSTAWSERATDASIPATLLIGRYPGEPSRRKALKIAAFDLDSTLITSASGKKNTNDPADWKWRAAVVPARLKQLYSDGYTITIFSNQGGLVLHPDPKSKAPKSKSSERVQNFKAKAHAILQALDLPSVVIYAATGQDIFRKPRTGMWTVMCEDLQILPYDIQLDSSFFVGDAGGRIPLVISDSADCESQTAPRDFSCSDRNFAQNVGVKFQTPEEFFLYQQQREFSRDLNLCHYPFSGADSDRALFRQRDQGQEAVVFCGPPGAGKSTFYWKHLGPLGYVRINQDILKSREKCFKLAAERLRQGHSIVIDNTNPDPETRHRWISLAGQHGASPRCVWFQTPIPLCEHNDAYRALNGALNPERRELLPKLAFTGFASRYRPPSLTEGFHDVIEIEFKFRGTEDEHKAWSQYWV